jgi:hypothetical protein
MTIMFLRGIAWLVPVLDAQISYNERRPGNKESALLVDMYFRKLETLTLQVSLNLRPRHQLWAVCQPPRVLAHLSPELQHRSREPGAELHAGEQARFARALVIWSTVQ